MSPQDICFMIPIGVGKMILAQFIKAVYVRRDYEIEVEFNVSFEEFQNLYLAKGITV